MLMIVAHCGTGVFVSGVSSAASCFCFHAPFFFVEAHSPWA